MEEALQQHRTAHGEVLPILAEPTTGQRENVRAIVLFGEADSLSTTQLGQIAREAVGTKTVEIMTDIDPSEAVAHGAAVWARMVQTLPAHIFMGDDWFPPGMDRPYHERLQSYQCNVEELRLQRGYCGLTLYIQGLSLPLTISDT